MGFLECRFALPPDEVRRALRVGFCVSEAFGED